VKPFHAIIAVFGEPVHRFDSAAAPDSNAVMVLSALMIENEEPALAQQKTATIDGKWGQPCNAKS
jgi:hypothetical protein